MAVTGTTLLHASLLRFTLYVFHIIHHAITSYAHIEESDTLILEGCVGIVEDAHHNSTPLNRAAGGTQMTKGMKPGVKAPASGQYKIIGPRGGDTGVERTVTKGEPLPPTPEAGQAYVIADRTKHKSGGD